MHSFIIILCFYSLCFFIHIYVGWINEFLLQNAPYDVVDQEIDVISGHDAMEILDLDMLVVRPVQSMLNYHRE